MKGRSGRFRGNSMKAAVEVIIDDSKEELLLPLTSANFHKL